MPRYKICQIWTYSEVHGDLDPIPEQWTVTGAVATAAARWKNKQPRSTAAETALASTHRTGQNLRLGTRPLELRSQPAPLSQPHCLTATAKGVLLLIRHSETAISIPLPFPLSETRFLSASNGWLLFVIDYSSYFLVDPVSHQKHWLPPLTRRGTTRQANAIKCFMLHKVVVSMSHNGGVAVAAVAKVYNKKGLFFANAFSYFEIGRDASWHISTNTGYCDMVRIVGGEEAKRRFYAADENWGLYLLEAGPLMRWRRFNIMLPKHILNKVGSAESEKKRLDMLCCSLTETDDGYLEAHGISARRRISVTLLVKVHGSGLRIDSKDANAYGDGKWTDTRSPIYDSNFTHTFTPRL